MQLNHEQIKEFIPHRDPFLFVDEIVGIEHPNRTEESSMDFKSLVGSVVKGTFFVREDLKILEGHFPGNPILPGVVQTEMMAQVACFTVYDLVEDPSKSNIEVALLNVNNAKYRKPVVPGMKLEVESTCTRVRGPMMSYECLIYCDGDLISQSDILATVKL